MSEHVQCGVHLSPRQEGQQGPGSKVGEARRPVGPSHLLLVSLGCLSVSLSLRGPLLPLLSEQLLAGGWGSGSFSVGCAGLPAPHLHMEARLAFPKSFSSPLNCTLGGWKSSGLEKEAAFCGQILPAVAAGESGDACRNPKRVFTPNRRPQGATWGKWAQRCWVHG